MLRNRPAGAVKKRCNVSASLVMAETFPIKQFPSI